MKIKTRIKAGLTGDCSPTGCGLNHNQTMACALKTKTNVTAGSRNNHLGLPLRSNAGERMPHNHNHMMGRSLKIKSSIQAGPSDSPIIRG